MLEHTDLSRVKAAAKMMVELPIHSMCGGLIVQHPYFTTTVAAVKEDGKVTMVDLNTKEGLKKAKASIRNDIDKIDVYTSFLVLISPPYLPAFFNLTKEFVSIQDYSYFLASMWTYIEFPNVDVNISKEQFVSLFKKADKKYLMNKNEYDIYKNFPEEITVYRGIRGRGKVQGLSWTLSKEQARWFANRFEPTGKVYSARIKKEDTLAYFSDRNEKEVVLDYRRLFDVSEVNE